MTHPPNQAMAEGIRIPFNVTSWGSIENWRVGPMRFGILVASGKPGDGYSTEILYPRDEMLVWRKLHGARSQFYAVAIKARNLKGKKFENARFYAPEKPK